MRLIDADALDFCFPMPDDFNSTLKQIGIEMAKARVVNAPTIEAEPVRHGRWIISGKEYRNQDVTCSECGDKHETYGWPRKQLEKEYQKKHYCPNCGAKMGGEDDA